MSFIERVINITFDLASDKFDAGGNSVTLTGLRCEATIDNINGVSLGALQMRIYGMTQTDMSKLSNLGKLYMLARRNVITVSAGDAVSGMTQIFKGTIYQGWIDYTGAPDVSFNISASCGYFEKMQPAAPFTHDGPTDVAAAIEAIASSIGFSFKNNGVTSQLDSHYQPGTAIVQIQEIAQAAGIACSIENNCVYIWLNHGTRDAQTVTLSPETGLIGYPTCSQYGIDVVCEFNPNIANGRKVTVKSAAQGAAGDWYTQVVRHEISAQVPSGPWFTTAQLTGEGFFVAQH